MARSLTNSLNPSSVIPGPFHLSHAWGGGNLARATNESVSLYADGISPRAISLIDIAVRRVLHSLRNELRALAREFDGQTTQYDESVSTNPCGTGHTRPKVTSFSWRPLRLERR